MTRQIADYCKSNIPNYEARLMAALDAMQERRCDLRTADWKLADDIEKASTEWADKHGYAVDFLDGIDVDEIINA